MAKNASVLKSISVANRNQKRNKIYKSMIKTLTKKFVSNLKQAESKDDLIALQSIVSMLNSKIDKAVKKGVLHKNNAARKKSFISKQLKLL
uniref:Small ribosomal subunit protein bS20c n=1 Tax=Hommersandiophycus borowitzkae TaxID=268573 RepID=A0A1G4NUE1_9FLOR|nr:Ribosomal protein S20 [Hommersandiophycus borowitzkae]SCW22166.1 Ribosomal protein S20 [Hommersandiophycus borowitzkae]